MSYCYLFILIKNMDYPEETVLILKKYIENFDNDIIELKKLEKNIKIWCKRGININNSIEPLQEQINIWETKMIELLNNLKDNIINLKLVDDRIDSNNKLTIKKLEEFSENSQKWEYLFDIYKTILENLKKDTIILYDIENKIKNYKKLGVELGDAIDKIQYQNNNIIQSINLSMTGLKNLIKLIKIESNKIIENEDVKDDTNNDVNSDKSNTYWAFYDKMNVDGESISVYLNDNYWDNKNDGLNILKHVELSYLNTRSTLYNSSVGDKQLHSKPEQAIKYIYYGYQKDNMIKLKCREDNWSSYYVDTGNCMIQGYFGSSQIMENGINSRKFFSEQYKKYTDTTYLNGAKTADKWFVIFSLEEINDLNKVVYKGE